MQSKTLQEIAESGKGKLLRENIPVTVSKDGIDVPAKDVDSFLSEYNLKNLPVILGTTTLGIDKKTLEKITHELKATAELTFSVRHEGV